MHLKTSQPKTSLHMGVSEVRGASERVRKNKWFAKSRHDSGAQGEGILSTHWRSNHNETPSVSRDSTYQRVWKKHRVDSG